MAKARSRRWGQPVKGARTHSLSTMTRETCRGPCLGPERGKRAQEWSWGARGRPQGLQGHREQFCSHSQNNDESLQGIRQGGHLTSALGPLCLRTAPAPAPRLHGNPRWPPFESITVLDSPPHALEPALRLAPRRCLAGMSYT